MLINKGYLMLLCALLIFVVLPIVSSSWCTEVIQDVTPAIEIVSIKSFLEKFRSIKPDVDGNFTISQESLSELHTIFGCWKGDPKYFDDDHTVRISYNPNEINEMFQLIGKYHIADVSSDVADHLTFERCPFDCFDQYNIAGYSALQTMVSFGEGGVPLVLERLCRNSQHEMYGTEKYFWFSMKYMEKVYEDEFANKIRALATQEEDVTMRTLLVERVLPHAEQYVNGLKAKEARERYRRERKYEGIEKLVTPEQLKRLKSRGEIPNDGSE